MPQTMTRTVRSAVSEPAAPPAGFDDEHWSEQIHAERDWETRVAMMDHHLRLLSSRIEQLRHSLG